MAFYKQDIVDVNLETGVIHRSFLNHTIGHKDDDADRFGIRAFRNGEPVDLSGAQCQAVFMAPDGTNIALTSYGTVSGNEAYVTLPQACYNVEGQFCLAIKLVGGGVTATVRIIDGVVDRTGATGAVAPTEAVPTYQEILAVYAEMQEDVADYESVVATQNGKIDDLKSALSNNPFRYINLSNPEVGNRGESVVSSSERSLQATFAQTWGHMMYPVEVARNTNYKLIANLSGSSGGSRVYIMAQNKTDAITYGQFSVGDTIEVSFNTGSNNIIYVDFGSGPWSSITITISNAYTVEVGNAFVDTTLTKSGYAADAKATGDEINDIKLQFGNTTNEDLITLYGIAYGDYDFPSVNKFAENISLKSTGEYQSYIGWWSSDLINIVPIIGKTLYFEGHGFYNPNFTIPPVIFLDSNKEIVSYYQIDKTYAYDSVKGSIVIPSDAVYMILSSFWIDPGHTGYEETDKYATDAYVKGVNDSLPFPIIKREDIKIICCGDSITEGDYGSNPSGTANTHKESYPYFLAKYFGVNIWRWEAVNGQYVQLENTQGINVINLGKNGSRPSTWYSSIYTNYKNLFKYENNKRIVVIMMFGTNGGFTDTIDEDTASGDYETYANTETGRYCRVIEEIMELSEGHAEIVICTSPYVNPATRPNYAENVATSNPITKKIAAKYNLPVIDTFAELGLSTINTSVLQPIDGLHFGYYGYSRLGTFIGSKIKGLLSFTYDIVN